jgi:hypothetical protein
MSGVPFVVAVVNGSNDVGTGGDDLHVATECRHRSRGRGTAVSPPAPRRLLLPGLSAREAKPGEAFGFVWADTEQTQGRFCELIHGCLVESIGLAFALA